MELRADGSRRGLWTGFLRSAKLFPDRPAVVAQGTTLSYRELREVAVRIAACIQAHREGSSTPLTAVFAHRSTSAFAGVLGSLLAGNGYVPLNRTFPVERTRSMLVRSECRSIIVDAESLPQMDALMADADQPLLVIAPGLEDPRPYRERWPLHIIVGAADLEGYADWREPDASEDAIAYLLFTSGSTGVPKGVMVAHRNVAAYVDHVAERFDITELDVVSQTFDMTFDLSASDMFVAWERGACVCCPSQKTLINPGRFIREQGLTVWFSVPSMVALMKQSGLLKPGGFPSLRLSLFCGEPLPVRSVEAWAMAAPNSVVENVYGPTELTIACTGYRWDPKRSPAEAEMGIVPIGAPFPGMNVLVVDEHLNEVEPGADGELLMSGPQMSLGYWKDPEKTAAAFVVPPGRQEMFYRTGDRVRRPAGDGPLTHLGRMDSQVKILGHRVELGEVEAVVREASGVDGVVAIGWPITSSGYGGIEVLIEGGPVDLDRLRAAVAARLPDYMVPRRWHVRSRLPRNANGKYDRKAMPAVLGDSQ
ncbi:amino acid adenylation domain-containing protein [Bradyrhizobium sp. B097]|uniref:amino acid adenylation domain-containing protein n=1 Tax=Bradyrhizobium sp. B097 TaxID=3140244 RepID=UPI00318462E4